jgi:P-type E1-E2 ATPase
LALAASVEEHANHPIAEAVVRFAKRKALSHIEHDAVDFIVAHGLRTHSNGQSVLVGSRHFLEEHEGIAFADYTSLIDDLEDQGKTLLYLATENAPLGIIALRDRVRPEARETLRSLEALGVTSRALLTGDQRSKALSLAAQLGIDEVFSDMEPAEKAEIIQQLQHQGRQVAFVGDGVNDAPALVSADVGIAMPRAADIARVTADIILLEDRLEAVAEVKALANQTMQLIQSNFKLAVGINSAVLLGAALGWLSPIATALLHNGATIGILLRALTGIRQPMQRLPVLPETSA